MTTRHDDKHGDGYRKKPVVIQAKQWHRHGDHPEVRRPINDGVRYEAHDDCGIIDTLEGRHIVSPGDWIIRGVKGEFYACKPDIFEQTYEPASVVPSATAPSSTGCSGAPGSCDDWEAAEAARSSTRRSDTDEFIATMAREYGPEAAEAVRAFVTNSATEPVLEKRVSLADMNAIRDRVIEEVASRMESTDCAHKCGIGHEIATMVRAMKVLAATDGGGSDA